MNKRQADKAIKVIRADSRGHGRLMTAEGDTCALGGLLQAAGEPKRSLLRRIVPSGRQKAILKKVYGIDSEWLDAIWMANDGNSVLRERRSALVRVIRRALRESLRGL